MKRNKLAAGALALALGLGAVAPSFAADTTSTKTEVAATTLFQEKYAQELEKAQALHKDATAKKAALDKADLELANAEEAVQEAVKAYNAIQVSDFDETLKSELDNARAELSRLVGVDVTTKESTVVDNTQYPVAKIVGDASTGYTIELSGQYKPGTLTKSVPANKEELKKLFDVYQKPASTESEELIINPLYNANSTDAALSSRYVADSAYVGNSDVYKLTSNDGSQVLYVTNNKAKAQAKTVTNEEEISDKLRSEFYSAYERYVNAWNLYEKSKVNNLDAKDRAYQALKAAQSAYDVAVTNQAAAKKAADPALRLYNEALAKLKGAAEAYNVVIVATNNGIEVKGEKEAPAKKDVDYVGLQAAIDRANETLRAVELLEKLTPNTAANNRAKLNALVAEQKATIAKAEAILKAADKKVALVATAYAAEEEVTAEDVDALIKELDDNTDAIQKELKDLDKDVKVDEEKPAEDDKKEDKKPADEDKKEDDKKEDKSEDKKEDKADDKKVDTTKVVNKSANKTAGSNAKTGIAGVAGVAGVLAAASVAYAASKKNN